MMTPGPDDVGSLPASLRLDPSSAGGGGVAGGTEVAPGVRVPDAALRFAFSRSSGPGGQHVNKTNTQAELRVDLDDLAGPGGLRPAAVRRLRDLAGSRLTKDDELVIVASDHRSQSRNRKACLERLRGLLVAAMATPKRRKPTRPSRGSIERRIRGKKRRGEIKRMRKSPPDAT